MYYYGARYLDPTDCRWLSPDPKWDDYKGVSPYAYCLNNPVKMVDPDGEFTVNADDSGLSPSQLERFETVVKNIGNLLKNGDRWDDKKLEEISKITGLSTDEIKKNMEYGKGPEIYIRGNGNGNSRSTDGKIVIDSKVVEDFSKIDINKTSKYGYKDLSKETLGVSMLIFHEYGHWGDQKTNNGYNTGQFDPTTGLNYVDTDFGSSMQYKSLQEGKQFYKLSLSGHRGDDMTNIFGVSEVEYGKRLEIKTSNSNPLLKQNSILSKLKVK